jgi:hypothetical protein
MTVSPSIPATVEIRRSRLLTLVAAVAVVASGSTWAIAAATDSTGSAAPHDTSPSLVQQAQAYGRGLTEIGKIATASSSYANGIARLSRLQQAAAFGGPGAVLSVLYGLTPKEALYVRGITSMSSMQQAAAFGGPGAVLDALGLSAGEKQYVQGITSMSTKQQAAAFGR